MTSGSAQSAERMSLNISRSEPPVSGSLVEFPKLHERDGSEQSFVRLRAGIGIDTVSACGRRSRLLEQMVIRVRNSAHCSAAILVSSWWG
jgi:hypothetical protein